MEKLGVWPSAEEMRGEKQPSQAGELPTSASHPQQTLLLEPNNIFCISSRGSRCSLGIQSLHCLLQSLEMSQVVHCFSIAVPPTIPLAERHNKR